MDSLFASRTYLLLYFYQSGCNIINNTVRRTSFGAENPVFKAKTILWDSLCMGNVVGVFT
ncbi:hypothetical protein [Epilithonimonas pallida]|jgi:hypothetical protein|uniref:hypothetical protein n=1 Tax=Epilithonimonas pallida TaxID=373671 RepID=UPI0024B860CB|nr:hypothetical protein [Epilithonimonas pallida]